MNDTIYDVNRPVHVARRDVFMEKAYELFQSCLKTMPSEQRLKHIDFTMYCLQSALEHATLARRSAQADSMEESVVVLIRMVLYSLYSGRVMLENEIQLEKPDSPLCRFLYQDGKNEDAMNFSRNSEQLLHDADHLFRMSNGPFLDLQRTLIGRMTDDDRQRYERARDNLREHLADHSHHHAIKTVRTFYPTPALTYG